MNELDIRKATDSELLEFAKQMHKASVEGFDTAQGVLDYFEAPWKWAKEFELWSTLPRPHEGDHGWTYFCETIWRGEGAVREALLEQAALS